MYTYAYISICVNEDRYRYTYRSIMNDLSVTYNYLKCYLSQTPLSEVYIRFLLNILIIKY